MKTLIKEEDFKPEGDKPSRLAADRGNRYGDYLARHQVQKDKDESSSEEETEEQAEDSVISAEALKVARQTDLS